MAVSDWRANMVLYGTMPVVGSAQEFTVDSSGASAKQSRPSNVIISTKSGTNQVHGQIYEVMRNNSLTGMARRREEFWSKPPQYLRHEYGGNVGGPVYLPRIYNGKNRTFAFVNYEVYRANQPNLVSMSVPTAEMRNGDFSALRDSLGRLQTLYDPLTTDSRTGARQPFAYGGRLNTIDPGRISPVAKYLYSITPLPTTGDNPLVGPNWWGTTQRFWINNALTARVDHQVTAKDHIYFRWTDFLRDSRSPGVYTNEVAGWNVILDDNKNGVVNWVRTVSPTLINELTAGVRRKNGVQYTGSREQRLDTDWFAKPGLPHPFLDGRKMWPNITGTGFNSYTSVGTWIGRELFLSVDDGATKIHGPHQFEFGGRIRRDRSNTKTHDGGHSSIQFGTQATSLYDSRSTPVAPLAVPQTGHNAANFFLGHATYQASLIRNWYEMRQDETALYFQDTWKVTPRLTLNLGLRWERFSPLREKTNIMTGFDPSDHSTVLGTDVSTMVREKATLPSIVQAYEKLGWKHKTWQEAGLPQNLNSANNLNFGPRLGFAYRLSDGRNSMVVRGGYGISYYRMPLDFLDAFNSNTPLNGTFNYNLNDATQSPDGISNYWLRTVPQTIAGVNSVGVIGTDRPVGITRGTASATYLDPDLKTPRIQSWNLQIEKQLGSSSAVSVRYVGNSASRMNQYYSYNDPTPPYIWYATTGEPLPTGQYANVARRPYDRTVFGSIREWRSTGYSRANNFSFEIERRFDRGYAYQVSYVVANVLRTGDWDVTGGTPSAVAGTVPSVNQFMPGAVPSDYDERNRFLNYQRDTQVPKHSLKWNGLMDLPFGAGKPLGRSAGGVLNRFIGGWQIAALGRLNSNYFDLPTGLWSFTGEPISLFGYDYPISDCRSGSCYPGYLWWNGYIPPTQINSYDAAGKPNGIMGVPADYMPVATPINNDPTSPLYGSNEVTLTLKNNAQQRVAYNTGLHPWRNQFLPSVRQWGLDATLFKSIPLREGIRLRFAADFFNVLNHPGNESNVGATGILSTRDSGQEPRIIQLSGRLTW